MMRTVGCVGRFRPLHLGSAAMLDSLCKQAEQAIIGVGSANKYDARNPWTAEETGGMIDAYLSPRFTNYQIILVPDYAQQPEYADGQRWKSHVRDAFGELDAFVTGNAFVEELLKDTYRIIHPLEIIPPERMVPVHGTMVRNAMAVSGPWERLVPAEVADYLGSRGLVGRFRDEFGLETMASFARAPRAPVESARQEREYARGGEPK